MTEPRQDVVAVIPAYECAVTIGEVVAGVLPQVSRVIVVDDGATDGTGEVAAAAGAEVIRNPANRGKGNALRRAFDLVIAERRAARERGEEPRVEAVAMLDGDGQHDPADLPVLLAAWDERDTAWWSAAGSRSAR